MLASTPVVMAMLATLLAGLSSSEMTRAQYDRSMAAQMQSKAGDQWSLFQAKRIRESIDQSAATTLDFSSDAPVLRGAKLKDEWSQVAKDAAPTNAIGLLADEGQSMARVAPQFSPRVAESLRSLGSPEGEEKLKRDLPTIDEAEIDGAINSVLEATKKSEQIWAPADAAVADAQLSIDEQKSGPTSLRRDLRAAGLQLETRRYKAEAQLNQALANLYELKVRKSNLSADRHNQRSQRFFFGMLFAQGSVILSTLSNAVRLRNTLWTIAAIAGVCAVALAAYVYLWN